MLVIAGHGIAGVTLEDQLRVVEVGPGNARLPTNVGTPVTLTLHRLMNKIKHRNSQLTNFRIEAQRHIFLICPENSDGTPEGISEFDVVTFCEQCKVAASEIR